MTLLDDYEVRYKIRGAEIVSELLKAVPSELLKRTGVDSLLYTVCFKGPMSNLHTHPHFSESQRMPQFPSQSG